MVLQRMARKVLRLILFLITFHSCVEDSSLKSNQQPSTTPKKDWDSKSLRQEDYKQITLLWSHIFTEVLHHTCEG